MTQITEPLYTRIEKHTNPTLVTLIHGHNSHGERDYLQSFLNPFRVVNYTLGWYETRRQQIGLNRWRSPTMTEEYGQALRMCRTAVEFLQPPKHIIVGHSTGAAIAFAVAKEVPTDAVIAYLPLVDYPRLGAQMRRRLALSVGETDLHPESSLLENAFDTNIDSKEFNYKSFFGNWMRWSLDNAMNGCNTPALFIAAQNDTVATPTEVLAAAQSYGGTCITVRGKHIPTIRNATVAGALTVKLLQSTPYFQK